MSVLNTRISKTQSIELTGRAIELVIGADSPVTLFVHEDLICASSDHFRKALSGAWKKSEEGRIVFNDEEPEIFYVYLHWLYRRTIPVRVDEPGELGNAEFLQLAKLFTLGQRLQDGDFQDIIIDAIIDKCNTATSDGSHWCPVGPVIRHIYENTVESSKARRLLVDLYISNGSGSWLRDWMTLEDTPKGFVYDIAMGFLEKRAQNPKTMSDLCEYHQHGSQPTLCYKTRSKGGILPVKAEKRGRKEKSSPS